MSTHSRDSDLAFMLWLRLPLDHEATNHIIDDADERVHQKFLSAYEDFVRRLYDRDFRGAAEIDEAWNIQDALEDLGIKLPTSYEELVSMIR